MLVLTIADRALTVLEVATIARDRAAAIWTMTGPTRRAAKVYARALWAGAKAATPTALAAIATVCVLVIALGLLAYRRGAQFRSWCDELVSAAENPPVPAAIAIPPALTVEPPAPPVPAPSPITAAVSAAALRKICAREGMKGAARANRAACLEFLAQLAQSPENPSLSPVATAGG